MSTLWAQMTRGKFNLPMWCHIGGHMSPLDLFYLINLVTHKFEICQ